MDFVLNNNGILIIVGFFVLLFMILGSAKMRKKRDLEASTNNDDSTPEVKSHQYAPPSLHPIIDTDVCIGSGACISACPEQDVLGLRSRKAVVLSPSSCLGHGMCERSCPVNAISFGNHPAKKGLNIPKLQENFETNVSGLFVIGELAGMGLIQNAIEQARQCVSYFITKELPKSPDDTVLDMVIVGLGPAGLAASIYANNLGLRYKTLEREEIGSALKHYPRKKIILSKPLRIPNYGILHRNELYKDELPKLWKDIVEQENIGKFIETDAGVESITKGEHYFTVESERFTLKSRQVILAIGTLGKPTKFGIKGEHLPNVSYGLKDVTQFQNMNICIVGEGKDAIDAAIKLGNQPGNNVVVSTRGKEFKHLTSEIHDRFIAEVQEGKISVLWETTVVENRIEEVVIQDKKGTLKEVANDYLFVFMGNQPSTNLLTKSGVKLDAKFGEPRFKQKIQKAGRVK